MPRERQCSRWPTEINDEAETCSQPEGIAIVSKRLPEAVIAVIKRWLMIRLAVFAARHPRSPSRSLKKFSVCHFNRSVYRFIRQNMRHRGSLPDPYTGRVLIRTLPDLNRTAISRFGLHKLNSLSAVRA